MYRYILIVFTLFFISLQASTLTRTQIIKGTFITITADENYSTQINEAFEIFKRVDSSLSTFNSTSTTYRLNSNRSVKLDSLMFKALELSKNYYKTTNGYFDITIGSITKDAYRFGEEQRVASKKSLKNSMVNFSKLHYNRVNATLENGIKIDFGGMGKGFGVDLVA